MTRPHPHPHPFRIMWRVLLMALLVFLPLRGQAASTAETRAQEAIVRQFQDGLFDFVDKESLTFIKQYPESELLAGVVLLRAQALLKLKLQDEALNQLNEKSAAAGKLADEFRFWSGQARLEKGDLQGAAHVFGQVASEFPSSPRRLEASFLQASLLVRLGDHARGIALLKELAGTPPPTAGDRTPEDWGARAGLLLAETLLKAGDAGEALKALEPLASRKLGPELEWQCQLFQARGLLAANQPAPANQHASNLWTTVTNSLSREWLAEAAITQGEILERLGQTNAALPYYSRILSEPVASSFRRFALQKTIELSLNSGNIPGTVAQLQAFADQHRDDEILDVVHFALGELRLREYRQNRATPGNLDLTNLLRQARAGFDMVLTNYTKSPLTGLAHLNRGWTLWEEGGSQLGEGLISFQAAASRFPGGPERAIALSKAADCQERLGDLPGAVSNYWQVITNSGGGTNVVSQALLQAFKVTLDSGQLPGAESAVRYAQQMQPPGQVPVERMILQLARHLNAKSQSSAARSWLTNTLPTLTDPLLSSEYRLTLAATFEQENNLPAAQMEYNRWLELASTNQAIPRDVLAGGNFQSARVAYQLSADTNSLRLLTNFIASFPESTNVPQAHYLTGEYYFGLGDYEQAQLSFQQKRLLENTNAPFGELACRARLMAGRAAVAGQRYKDAREHFVWVITNGPLSSLVVNSPIPVPVAAEAYLLLGGLFLSDPGDLSTNTAARYREALTSYSKVAERLPPNEYVPTAWGEIGNCYLQLAALDPSQASKLYDSAADAFTKAMATNAAISVRSQAEVGLGIVLEKHSLLKPPAEQAALLTSALDHFLRVFYGKNSGESEQPDPYYVKQAGLAAAELAEKMKRYEVAVGIYERLIAELPLLRARFEPKLLQLRQLASPPPAK